MLNTALAACVYAAAQLYGLPPPIIWSVLAVEGGSVGTVSHNHNGTDDLGPAQINSSWVPRLARHYGVAPGEVRQRLIDDPCYNVAVGAWILREAMVETGDFWNGVGRYHSARSDLKERYMRRVVGAAGRLFGNGVFAPPDPRGAAGAKE
jgi:soluble lytic murein transglycosylase-like protein